MYVCNAGTEVEVLKSGTGYYIGTRYEEEDGFLLPNCRCSEEYFQTKNLAENALKYGKFTIRYCEENIFCHGGKGCF